MNRQRTELHPFAYAAGVAVFVFSLCWLTMPSFTSAEEIREERANYPSFYTDSLLRETVMLGTDLTIREQYDTADSIFADLERRFPMSPVGPLFRAAVLQTKMLDREDGRPATRLRQFVDAAIFRAKRWEKIAPDDPEPVFYQAAALGYWAVHESHWGGWFSALKQGLKAANRFKKVVELEPEFYDAYLGLGNYNYFKSAKTGFITWLPFVPDNREKGIRQLRLAIERGTFTPVTARTSLMWVLLDFGLPVEGLKVGRGLHDEYPESKAFLWGIGLCAYSSYRWDECIAAFDSLEVKYLAEGGGNYFNLVECTYYKAEAAYQSGDYQRSREECRRAFSYPLSKETRKRLKDRLTALNKRYRTLGKYSKKGG